MHLNRFSTIEWKNNTVVMIDQRKLPTEEKYNVYKTSTQVARAIKDMVIRGAPAIGVAAAMGIALGAKNIKTENKDLFFSRLQKISDEILATRPTAVNLFWAVKRMNDLANSLKKKKHRQSAKKT